MQQTAAAPRMEPKGIYQTAGVMALLIALAGLTDAATSMGVTAQDNRSIPVAEWFAMFQAGRFEPFSLLGVINIITLSLGVPVYLALHQAFRKERPALSAFAALAFFTGTAIYLSSNTVFALFAASRQAAASAPAPLLEAAGRALLAQGADLTPGTFAGLFLTQAAGLLITGAMLRGSAFGRWTGAVGLAGYGLMMAFFVLTAFFPAHYATAMMVAAPGGLTLLAYQIMLARKFFQLGR